MGEEEGYTVIFNERMILYGQDGYDLTDKVLMSLIKGVSKLRYIYENDAKKKFAKLIDGTIIGDENIHITGVSGIKEAKKGDITFIAKFKVYEFNGCYKCFSYNYIK